MSALGRKFVKNVDAAVRTVETSLTYMDAALRGYILQQINQHLMTNSHLVVVVIRIPCHKTFIAYFEHVKLKPSDIVHPLSKFLELDEKSRKVLMFACSFSF